MSKQTFALMQNTKDYLADPAKGFPNFNDLYSGTSEEEQFLNIYVKRRKKFKSMIIAATLFSLIIGVFMGVGFLFSGANAIVSFIVGTGWFVFFAALIMPWLLDYNKPDTLNEKIYVDNCQTLTFHTWVNARYGLNLTKENAATLLHTGKLFITTQKGYMLGDVQGVKHVFGFDGVEVPVKI